MKIKKSWRREWARLFARVVAYVLAAVIGLATVRISRVEGNGMEPKYQDGDLLMALR